MAVAFIGTTATRKNRKPSGACAFESCQDLVGFQFARELDLDDFVEPFDAERQREREDDAGAGVETGGGLERKIGAAKHALRAAHEIVVGEQPERAGLGEAEAEFVTEHRPWPESPTADL